MCIKTKLSCVRGENAWRFPMTTGLLGFASGISTFGVAMKLSEYKDSPSLPPFLAAIPMLGAGITGMVGGRMRKQCLISLHLALCLIAGVFSLHLMFLFLGTEADSRDIHKAKCLSNFKGSHYCHRYATYLAISGLSILGITLAPLGILSYFVVRRMSAHNANEFQEANNPAYESHPDPELSPRRTEDEHIPQQLPQGSDRVTDHARKAVPRSQDQRQLHHKNYHDITRLPPSHRQPYDDNINRRDLIRYNRAINQQQNMLQGSRAPRESCQQRNMFPVYRLPGELHPQQNMLEVTRASREISQMRNMPQVSRAPREIYQQRNMPLASRAPRESYQQRDILPVPGASREMYQQRNMLKVSRAPQTRFGPSHVPSAGQRAGQGLSKTTDTSFA